MEQTKTYRETKSRQNYGAGKAQHTEGEVARNIEEETAKIPSDVYLWVAVGAMAASSVLQLMKQKHAGLFIGQWVAPLLLFGIYNKMVKQQGHDALS